MTDLEKAVAKWLPELLNEPCPFCDDRHHSLIVATPELGFRLLEAMLRKSAEAIRFEFMSELFLLDTIDGPVFDGPDLLTAIIKAAAALAEKEQP